MKSKRSFISRYRRPRVRCQLPQGEIQALPAQQTIEYLDTPDLRKDLEILFQPLEEAPMLQRVEIAWDLYPLAADLGAVERIELLIRRHLEMPARRHKAFCISRGPDGGSVISTLRPPLETSTLYLGRRSSPVQIKVYKRPKTPPWRYLRIEFTLKSQIAERLGITWPLREEMLKTLEFSQLFRLSSLDIEKLMRLLNRRASAEILWRGRPHLRARYIAALRDSLLDRPLAMAVDELRLSSHCSRPDRYLIPWEDEDKFGNGKPPI